MDEANQNEQVVTSEPESGNTLLTTSPESSEAEAASPEKQTQPAAGQAVPEAPQAGAVPEAYDIKVPEGMELDREMLDHVTPLFKELKLSGEQAQKLADVYSARVAETRKAQIQAWNSTLLDWRAAAARDPEIGGAAFAENVSVAKAALDRFGTPELKQAMDHYGMGNHPELIRLLCRVGKALKPDNLVVGDGSGGTADPGKILYPDMN